MRAAIASHTGGVADSVAAHAGVVSEQTHEALRADIHRLSTLLGQTLVQHGGPELLELVERVRTLSRTAVQAGDDAEITALLRGLDRRPRPGPAGSAVTDGERDRRRAAQHRMSRRRRPAAPHRR